MNLLLRKILLMLGVLIFITACHAQTEVNRASSNLTALNNCEYYVLNPYNVPCICLNATLSVNFKYKPSNSSEEVSQEVSLPGKDYVNVVGDCSNYVQYLTINWLNRTSRVKNQNSITFHFLKQDKNYYFNMLTTSFSSDGEDKKTGYYINGSIPTTELFNPPELDHRFSCNARSEWKSEKVTITLDTISFYAFSNNTDEKYVEYCPSRSYRLPLIIGLVAAVFILIPIIVLAIYRLCRIKKRVSEIPFKVTT